jgi:hypothetical protein
MAEQNGIPQPPKSDRPNFLHEDEPVKPSNLPEESIFTTIINTDGRTPTLWDEKITQIFGLNKDLGVQLDEHHQIEFDQDKVVAETNTAVADFISQAESGYLDDYWRWYFESEGPDFPKQLAEFLKTNPNAPFAPSEQLENANLEARLKQAAKLMKTSAERKIIKKAMESQLPLLPFELKDDQDKVINLNPNDIEYIFVNTDEGPELIITPRKGHVAGIDFVEDSDKEPGKFKINGAKKEVDNQPKPGKDGTCILVDVSRNSQTSDPLFTRVRVLKNPIDIEKAIDEFTTEQTNAHAKKQQTSPPPVTPSTPYAPPAPSVPSTPPRWSPPQTHGPIRSG